MSKIEVIATSFILTLTVISTAPLQAKVLRWNLDLLKANKIVNESFKLDYNFGFETSSKQQNYFPRKIIDDFSAQSIEYFSDRRSALSTNKQNAFKIESGNIKLQSLEKTNNLEQKIPKKTIGEHFPLISLIVASLCCLFFSKTSSR